MNLRDMRRCSKANETELAGARQGAVRMDGAAGARNLCGEELGLIPLGALKEGETGLVYDFVAGHSLVSRMAALGFTPDARVTMVQNFGHGPVIVSIRGTRIALGRGEAAKVRIRRSDEEQ
jgi:ferrous iron transport protein A